MKKMSQWANSPQSSGVRKHTLCIHTGMYPHIHMPVFCVTDSTTSALSSGWDVSSSDLNSPQEEKPLYHYPQISQNLLTGLHPATWKTDWLSGPLWWPAGQRKGETCTDCRWTGDFLLHCCQVSTFHQHPISARNSLKEKKEVLWSRVLLCIIPEHKGALSSREGLLGIGSVSQTVIIKIIYSIIFVSRDFPCLSLPLELVSLKVKTMVSLLLLEKQKKRKDCCCCCYCYCCWRRYQRNKKGC